MACAWTSLHADATRVPARAAVRRGHLTRPRSSSRLRLGAHDRSGPRNAWIASTCRAHVLDRRAHAASALGSTGRGRLLPRPFAAPTPTGSANRLRLAGDLCGSRSMAMSKPSTHSRVGSATETRPVETARSLYVLMIRRSRSTSRSGTTMACRRSATVSPADRRRGVHTSLMNGDAGSAPRSPRGTGSCPDVTMILAPSRVRSRPRSSTVPRSPCGTSRRPGPRRWRRPLE